MQVLALASSTESLSVAVTAGDQLFTRASGEKRRHSAVLLDMVRSVLADAGLDARQLEALAVDVGPGAFTGVRTAIAAVQGLSLAWSLPIIPVSALAAMCFQAPDAASSAIDGTTLCVLDARMGEVYHALLRADGRWASEPRVGPPAALRSHVDAGFSCVLSNLDADVLDAARATLPVTTRWLAAEPSAAGVLRFLRARHDWRLQGVAAHALNPMYVRNEVALTIEQRRELGHAA